MDLSELSTESDESSAGERQTLEEIGAMRDDCDEQEEDLPIPVPRPHEPLIKRMVEARDHELKTKTAPVSITRRSLPNLQTGPIRHTRHGSLTNSFYKTPYERCLPPPVHVAIPGQEDASPAFPQAPEGGLPMPDFSSFTNTFSTRRASSPMVTPEAPKKNLRRVFCGRTPGAKVSGDESSVSEECEEGGDPGADLKLEKVIGEGSQGHVYRAFSATEEKYYAVKVLKHEGRLHKIQREINFVARLSPHPHILSYSGNWERGGQIFLKMELCTHSLADFANQWQNSHTQIGGNLEHIEEETLWKYFTDIVLGLDRIHQAGYVHRDIKPSNIFFDAAGNLRIGDFGLLLPEGELDSREGDSRYLAAEAVEMDVNDRSLDIFSLGATFFELSSLIEMPQNENLWVLLRSGKIEEMDEFPVSYTMEYRKLIADMMHPVATNRPNTTQLLAHPRVRAQLTKRLDDSPRPIPYVRAIRGQVNAVPRCPRGRSRSYPRKSLTKRPLFTHD